MKEMEVLADLSPEDVPEASRFLLEINFTELSRLHVETQKYWILAVNAALTAQNRELARGAREKRARGRTNTGIPSRRKLGLVAIEQQIRKDGMHRPPTSNDPSTHHTQIHTQLQQCASSNPTRGCENRTEPTPIESHVSEATPLACYWLFTRITFLTI
jgi:hypothetical protein